MENKSQTLHANWFAAWHAPCVAKTPGMPRQQATRALEPLSYHMRELQEIRDFRAKRSRGQASWLARLVESDRGEGTTLLLPGDSAPTYTDAIVSKLIEKPLLVQGVTVAGAATGRRLRLR